MIFSPNNISSTNQSQNTNQNCNIEKCKYCSKRTRCNDYLVFLLEQIAEKNKEEQCPHIDFSAIENQVEQYVSFIIEQNTETINKLTESLENKYLELNQKFDSTIEQIDKQIFLVSQNNVISTISKNKSVSTEEVMSDIQTESGLVPYEKHDGVILEEKTNLFGKPTGKFKEVKQ